MEREEVFDAISTERDFQEKLKADLSRPDVRKDFHVGDTLSAIQYNLDKARAAWYIGADPHIEAMKYLRKIAGLCVQAGETYGMLPRENKDYGVII